MRRTGTPTWLTVLLALVGLVVLGPPALALLAGLIGLSIGLAVVAVKLAFVGLVVFGVVSVVRAIFGRRDEPRRAQLTAPASSAIDLAHEEALARDEAEKRALDEELARVMAQTGQLPSTEHS